MLLSLTKVKMEEIFVKFKHLSIFVLATVLLLGNLTSVFAELPKVELPVLTTSAGQSADIVTLNLLCEEVGLKYDYSDVPNVDMIKSGVSLGGAEAKAGFHVESYTDLEQFPTGTPFKTLLVAIGASLKGMGASGLSADDEVNRLNTILSYCKEQEIVIIGIHLGGVATRGATGSDNERMIDVVAKYADHLMVTEGGNQDGKFEKLGVDNNIGVTVLKNAFQLIDILEDMFN